MKNIIIAILTSIVLFAASAGTSMYLNQPVEDVNPEEEMKKLDLPPDEPFPELPVEEMVSQMPVAGRPDQQLTIEAVRQMTNSAEKRHKQLDEREKQLKKEEDRVQILFNDLKRAKDELTAFSEGIEAKVNAIDRMNVQLQKVLANIDARKKELEKLEQKTGIETDESAKLSEKVKTVKSWFEALEAQQAADILVEKANQGDLKFAAELLHSLQGRQQAKILSAIDDATLASELLDEVEIKPKKKEK